MFDKFLDILATIIAWIITGIGIVVIIAIVKWSFALVF